MLRVQRAENFRRQELIEEKSLQIAEEFDIESLFWFEKFKPLAWKSVREVTTTIKQVNGKTNKIVVLRFQISIYQKGLGFNNFTVYWRKNRITRTVEDLIKVLKDIIRAMKNQDIQPPELSIPECKSLPVIGQLTAYVAEIDAKSNTLKEELEDKEISTRISQEISGECNNFANLHPPTALDPIISMRIYMLFNYADNSYNSDILMWSQGVIEKVSNGSNFPKEGGVFHKKGDVLVRWDFNEDRIDSSSTSIVSIPTKHFNKQVQNSWRLDVSL